MVAGVYIALESAANKAIIKSDEKLGSVSIVVSIPACHVGDLGSIPRRSDRKGPLEIPRDHTCDTRRAFLPRPAAEVLLRGAISWPHDDFTRSLHNIDLLR